MTTTHTYAILEVSQATYDEIKKKLQDAGYQHQIYQDDPDEIVDMFGIALRTENPESG